MPQASLLSKLYELNYGALFRNLEGVTHEESLVHPEPGGNCINWVLGHILATRNRVLTLVGVEPIWPQDLVHRYSGRDEAGWSPELAVDLKAIAVDLARSQQALMGAIDHLPAKTLSTRSDDGRTLAEVLGFFHFHEAYHTGQVALLRRILGKQGVIKAPQRRSLAAET